MKKIFIALSMLFLFFALVPQVFATSYPSTCPSEAQSIVSGVGGCPAIDCTKFATICAKCCPVSARQIVVDHPTPKKEPTTPAKTPASPPTQPTSTGTVILFAITGLLVLGAIVYAVWHFFKWLLHYFKR